MKYSLLNRTRGALASPGFLLERVRSPKSRAVCRTFALVAATLAATADAQTPVQEIVVRARRESPAEANAPTAFATSIDTRQHAEEIETVTDALAETAGVQVRRFGGLGSFSTVSIRGSSSNQVQIYFDGVPLSRARNETVNLADLPIDSLERIDVYRGTVPVAFGVGATGGIVNLVPRTPSEEAETQLSATYGSFDTRKAVASHSQRIGNLGVLAHATYLGSDGDFPVLIDADTPHQGSPHQRRRNNAFNSFAGLVRASYFLDDNTQADLTSESFFKDEGVPGTDWPPLLHTSFKEFRSTTYGRIRRLGMVNGSTDAVVTVFGSFLNEQFEDPQREFGAARSRRDDVSTLAGGNFSLTWRAPSMHEIGFFTECAGEEFNGFDGARRPENREDPPQNRFRVSAALQDQIRFFDDRVVFVPTARYEHIEDQGSTFNLAGRPTGTFTASEDLWTPGAGLQIEVLDWLELRSNVSRLQRVPSFSERFGNRGSIQGNPNLDPEKGMLRDVGFRMHQPLEALPPAELQYAYFDNRIDDLIVILAVPGPHPLRPANADAHVRGHELSLHSRPASWLEVDVNYTRQDAKNLAKGNRGNQLPMRPRDELYSRAQISGEGWRAYYEFNLVGTSYTTPDNFARNRVDSRMIHTTGIRWSPLEWLTAGVEARNLGNDRAEDVASYPLPGRSYFGTLTINL